MGQKGDGIAQSSNRVLQRRAAKGDTHSLFSFGQAEEVTHWSRRQNTQQGRFRCGIVFEARQQQFSSSRRMNGIVKNRQPGCVLRFGSDAQQKLIGQLIASCGGWLTESDVQNVAVGIVSNANRVHRYSLFSLTNLVRGQNEIVLSTVRIKAKADDGDYAGISLSKVWG